GVTLCDELPFCLQLLPRSQLWEPRPRKTAQRSVCRAQAFSPRTRTDRESRGPPQTPADSRSDTAITSTVGSRPKGTMDSIEILKGISVALESPESKPTCTQSLEI